MRAVPARSLSALCALLATLTLLPAAASAATQSEIDAAIAKALAWAPTQHDATTGEPPSYERTGFYSGEWLAAGYAAAGLSAADVAAPGNPSFQDFLFTEAKDFWDSPSLLAPEYTGRLTLTAHAAGIDTARISPGLNLPAELVGTWVPGAGGFAEPNTFATAWGVLALRTSPLPAWALQPPLSWLRADQHADGGWSFFAVEDGEESNPDIAAAALGALCAGGVPAYDPTVRRGFAYLHGLQVKETGAIFNAEFGENIDTSSWTAAALQTCGLDPQSSEWTTEDGVNPIDHILSMQLGDGGFAWATGEPWFPPSTGHALRVLAGEGFAADPADPANPELPSVRPVPSIATGTPTPHVLAVELAPGNVRLCNVTAPVGAALSEVLEAAADESTPAGCIGSVVVSEGRVAEIDGVRPAGEDEAWLARLDRGPAGVAGSQPVGFGDLISLRLGPPPAGGQVVTVTTHEAGAPGGRGRKGKRGRRGLRGKAGRNATIACKIRRGHAGKKRVRCTVKRRGHG